MSNAVSFTRTKLKKIVIQNQILSKFVQGSCTHCTLLQCFCISREKINLSRPVSAHFNDREQTELEKTQNKNEI